MNIPNCKQDCFNCPFLPDPYDSDRYVCLKCGQDYSFGGLESGRGFGGFLLLLAIAILIALILSSDAPRPSQTPEWQPLPQRGVPQWRSQDFYQKSISYWIQRLL